MIATKPKQIQMHSIKKKNTFNKLTTNSQFQRNNLPTTNLQNFITKTLSNHASQKTKTPKSTHAKIQFLSHKFQPHTRFSIIKRINSAECRGSAALQSYYRNLIQFLQYFSKSIPISAKNLQPNKQKKEKRRRNIGSWI